MRYCRLIVALFATLVSGAAAFAASSSADVTHLHVQLLVPDHVLMAGHPTDLGIYFKLEPGWHIYWKNAGDSGEPPRVRWSLPDGVTASDFQFPAPKRLPLGPLMDFGYEDEVLFPLTISVDKNVKAGQVPLHAKVDWLVCREVCIPGKAELETSAIVIDHLLKDVPAPGADGEIYKRLLSRLPEPLPASDKVVFALAVTGFRLAVTTGQRETAAQFFPSEQNILNNPAPQTVTPTATGLILELQKDPNLTANPAQLAGVLELSGGRNYEIVSLPGTVAAPKPPTTALDAVKAAGLAFLGGIILNLMPCVFPVLFIKGLSLVQSSGEEKHKQRGHGLVYTLGIVVSFWVLVGVLLGLHAAGSTLGWGFQFQSPIFLGLMASLLFFLGLSLAGQFEIGLTLTSAGGSLAQKQGYAGSFFTGVLAVIVATPCTAPFMGAAVGFALAQSAFVTFAIFTALALGLALPYLLLTLQPAWTRLLPRPGVWMEVLKQATAVPIFATVIWLVWLFAQSAGVNALLGLLGGFLLLAIAGWVLGRWPAKGFASAIAVVVGLLAVALPIYAAQKYSSVPQTVTNKPSAHGPSNWEPYTPQLVEAYRAQGKPVFVDFTASWCLSCQVNEKVVLDREDVQKRLHDSGIALVRADWTRHDETIAQTLAGLGRSGVPTYVLYSGTGAAPKILPEVLTPGIVFDALDELKQDKQAMTTQANSSAKE
jgi:thiol:disulfide interchange protein DsbD